MTLPDFIVFAVTLAAIVLYGIWRGRAQRSREDYLLAGRTLPWPMVLLGVMATQASAITFISAPGQAFTDGMRFVQYYFGLPIAMVIICAVFIPVYRKYNVYTAYEYLERRFDKRTRVFTGMLFLFSRAVSTGISIYAPSIVISSILGWNIYITNAIVGGTLMLYTIRGGAKSIAYTQTIMFVVIISSMILAGIMVVWSLPGNMDLNDGLMLAGKSGVLNVITTNVDFNDKYTLLSGIFGGLFLSLSYFGTDQSQVGRFLAGKSADQSKLGLLMNGIVKIPMQFGILLIGALLVGLYSVTPSPMFFNSRVLATMQERAPAQVQSLQHEWDAAQTKLQEASRKLLSANDRSAANTQAQTDFRQAKAEQKDIRTRLGHLAAGLNISERSDVNYVFLHFVKTTMPVGLVGLIFAIIILASWGSISPALHSLASASMVDVHLRLFPQRDANFTRHIRLHTLGWGMFCVIISMAATRMGSLIETVNILGSLFYGPMLGIFLCAFFIRRASATAVFYGALLSELVIFTLWWSDAVSFLWLNTIGTAVVVLLAVVLPGSKSPPEHHTASA